MRAPFLALSWRGLTGEAAALASASGLRRCGWRLAAQRPGLHLWIADARPAPVRELGAGGGLVVGHLIGSADATGPVTGPVAGPATGPATGASDTQAEPATSAASRLCRQAWGAYVALLPDPATGGWSVFRDPSGAVDAYTWRNGPVDVLASSLAHLPAGLLPPAIGLDWDGIADLLRRPLAQSWRSPLAGIAAICPGDLHSLGGPPNTARAIWRPSQYVPDRAVRAPDPAWADRLRATAARAADGLARPYSRLISEVSGGLDSSIVNAALAEAGLGPRIAAALHYVGDRREGDERDWAAEVCARFDLPFVAAPLAPSAFDPATDFEALARDLRPPFAALDAARDRDTAARLRETGATAIVTGEGGDAVFYQMPSPKLLADLWRARGLGALGHPRHGELARRLRRSLWSVWREAAAPAPPLFGLGGLAGPRLAAPVTAPAHPWLADLDAVPPGKQLQIQALIGAGVSTGPSRIAAAGDLLQPLLAQPMMELALSIPSWELARGEHDRGLAREAFAPWLPPSIVARRAKGALTSFYARQAAASADALRPYLMDGVLADAGLLDRASVAAALEPDELIRRADGLSLISAAALEAWVRHWQTRVPDAASVARDRPLALGA